MAGQATLFTIPAGDWLMAGSGFLGVIFTIAAAILIEDRRRRGEARSAKKALRSVSDRAASASAKTAKLINDRASWEEVIAAAQAREALEDEYQFARIRFQPGSVSEWLVVRTHLMGGSTMISSQAALALARPHDESERTLTSVMATGLMKADADAKEALASI